MSREDYNRFLQDTKDLKALRYGYAFLNQENKELRLQYRVDVDSLRGKIDLLEGSLINLETKYEKLKESSSEAIEKAYKMAEGYKQLAVDKSQDLARLKKLMSGCCEMAGLKVGTVIIVLGLFIGGIFVIMGAI